MKSKLLTSCALFMVLVSLPLLSFAQEQGKFRGGFELGGLVPIEGKMGILLSLELKYNIKNNMNVGFQTEFTSTMENKDNSESLNLFSVSYDYYFHEKNKSFSPFIGGGLGYYLSSALDAGQGIRTNYNNPTCFIRTGFEIGHFRTSLNYNFIRRKNVESYNINHDYIAIHFGFYIGGGKWKK